MAPVQIGAINCQKYESFRNSAPNYALSVIISKPESDLMSLAASMQITEFCANVIKEH